MVWFFLVYNGIIFIIVGVTPRGCPKHKPLRAATVDRPYITLGDIIHWFKSMTTTRYRYGVKQNQWKPFPNRLWQRNYYERIIRHKKELEILREYIQFNPMNGNQDPENIIPLLTTQRSTT